MEIKVGYGRQNIIGFNLYMPDGIDFAAGLIFAAGDVTISIDGATAVNVTNLPQASGGGYRIVLTPAESIGTRLRINFIDQTATKLWLDFAINENIEADKDTWSFDTTTTNISPASGGVKFNNAVLANVTAIYINQSDISSHNITNSILQLETNDIFSLHNSGNGAIFAYYQVSGAIVDNTTWMTIPVTFVESTGAFALADILMLELFYKGVNQRSITAATINTEARLSELDAANLPASVASRMAEASINTNAGAVNNVTLVATTSVNSDFVAPDNNGIAAIQAQTDLIPFIGGRVDSNIGSINNNVIAATNLEGSTDAIVLGVLIGTPTATTLPTDVTMGLNVLSGRTIYIRTGPATMEARTIQSNTVTGIITVLALQNIPVATNVFTVT